MGRGQRARQVGQTLVCLLGRELSRAARPARREAQDAAVSRASAVRQALEDLGPFYIKVGQILATRSDFVPPAMIAELEKLHDRVAASPFTHFEGVLAAELGPRWASMFRHIDTDTPLGTASLAQVYRAVLTDGTPVAIKIQRPGVRTVVQADMALLRKVARYLGHAAPRFKEVIDIDAMLNVIFDAMRPELDFVIEAGNMKTARESAEDFKHVTVPGVLSATPRVLIQTLAPGCSIREANPADFSTQERMDIGADLLAFMYRGYFIERFFHADPHPGNVFVHPGSPAHLIDWGMVGRIDRPLSQSIVRVLLCLAQNDGAGVARAWVEMGHATPWSRVADFGDDMAALVPQVATRSLKELNFGLTLGSVLECSTRRGIKTSPMVSILGKSFANIEGSIRHLCPELSVIDVFEEQLRAIVFRIAAEFLSETQAARTLLEAIAGSGQVPQQARSIVRDLANRDLSISVNQGAMKRAGLSSVFGNRKSDVLLAAGALLAWRRLNGR